MPRKSKKGGGGSQTEEERLLLQQRRAQTEEEVTRQREEMLTLFLKVDHQKPKHFPQGCFPSGEHNAHHTSVQMLVRETAAQRPVVVCSQDKLKKDQRNTEVNLLKINDQWRTILRQTKGAELRGDLMVLSQTFEGQVDVLDNIIQVRSSKASAASPGSHRLSLCPGLVASLPVCRRWSGSCGTRSGSVPRRDVLTCRIWTNSGLSRRNSWRSCSSCGTPTCRSSSQASATTSQCGSTAPPAGLTTPLYQTPVRAR